jgi:3-oxoadipate enol-lactonase
LRCPPSAIAVSAFSQKPWPPSAESAAPVVEPSLERWFTKKFRDGNTTVIEGFRQMIARTSLDGYLGSGSALRDMNNIELLSQISAPTLIVVGRHDPSTPPSAAELLHSKIANSSLAIIEEAAHLPNIEQAKQFNEILEEFLARHSSTPRAHS